MKSLLLFASLLVVGIAAGCSTAPKTEARRDRLMDKADSTVDLFKSEDASADPFLKNAAGYAVFPTVGKGAAVVGGAYGKGVLYERGVMVGYCDVTQASIGAQVGGQKFSEIIAFQSADSLSRFKNNEVSFQANASAVALKSGAAAAAKYEDGIVVFTRSDAGLMAEAAIGGQKFTYTSAADHRGDADTARVE